MTNNDICFTCPCVLTLLHSLTCGFALESLNSYFYKGFSFLDWTFFKLGFFL
ncbi:unnamed protein product [Arabidopsis thaliana]|uniref:(thale cress) hypothetical protein n=1 Tax=Arabidopsis thaliana TaxID=3702 RepID=A0A7G2EBI8_ARATH|nr:unnamed protein product [Arabidopsis thaliana]